MVFTKLRQNYRLSKTLASILFIFAYAFSCWQRAYAATYLVLQRADIWLAIASALFLGIILQFLLPVLVNLFLGLARVHSSVPTAEYCVIAYMHFALGFVLCGIADLFGWFFPVASVWISAIVPVVVTLAVGFLFFKVTSKLYFNDVTTPSYAVAVAVAVCVIVLLCEVAA